MMPGLGQSHGKKKSWYVLTQWRETGNVLSIIATAVTLGQGHRKSSSTFPQGYTFFVPNMLD